MTDIPELQRLLVGAAGRRIRRRRRVRGGLRFALGLGVVALCAVALLQLQSAAPDREVPASAPAPTAAPTDAIRERYGVFRRPARSQDKARTGYKGSARLIASTKTWNTYLVLRSRDMCVMALAKRSSVGSGGCGRQDTYVDGQRPLGTSSANMVAFAFPDGVEEVTLTLADDSSATYPVTDNGFAREVPARPVRLEWTAPDGEAAHVDFADDPRFAPKTSTPSSNAPKRQWTLSTGCRAPV